MASIANTKDPYDLFHSQQASQSIRLKTEFIQRSTTLALELASLRWPAVSLISGVALGFFSGYTKTAYTLLLGAATYAFAQVKNQVSYKEKRVQLQSQALEDYAKYVRFYKFANEFIREQMSELLENIDAKTLPQVTFKAVELDSSDEKCTDYVVFAVKFFHALIKDLGIPKAKINGMNPFDNGSPSPLSQGFRGALPIQQITEERPPKIRLSFLLKTQDISQAEAEASAGNPKACPICLDNWSEIIQPCVSTAHKIHPLCKACFDQFAQIETGLSCPTCRDNICELRVAAGLQKTHIERDLKIPFEPSTVIPYLNHSPNALPENYTPGEDLGGIASNALFSKKGKMLRDLAGALLARNLPQKHEIPIGIGERTLSESQLTILQSLGVDFPEVLLSHDESNAIFQFVSNQERIRIVELDLDGP